MAWLRLSVTTLCIKPNTQVFFLKKSHRREGSMFNLGHESMKEVWTRGGLGRLQSVIFAVIGSVWSTRPAQEGQPSCCLSATLIDWPPRTHAPAAAHVPSSWITTQDCHWWDGLLIDWFQASTENDIPMAQNFDTLVKIPACPRGEFIDFVAMSLPETGVFLMVRRYSWRPQAIRRGKKWFLTVFLGWQEFTHLLGIGQGLSASKVVVCGRGFNC